MELGRFNTNSIYCEDSYKAIKDLPDHSVDCIYTDIPYLYKDNGSGSSPLAKRIMKRRDELSSISDGIDYNILNEFARVLKKINCFIWCSKMQIYDILKFFNGFPNKTINFEILTWNKTNPTPSTNNVWLPDIERQYIGFEIEPKWFKVAEDRLAKTTANGQTSFLLI